MHTSQLPRGVIVPTITPLLEQDRLDVAALERVVDRVLAGGVQGLFLVGSCGEGPSLSQRLKREVVERVCRQVARRATVIVCVSDPSPVQSADLAACAADSGANAIAVAPPFYYPLTQPELYEYMTRRAAEFALPLISYNFPALVKVKFQPDTVRRLLDNPRVVGFKDTSGDIDYFQEIRRVTSDRPDFRLYMGPEHLLVAATRLGGDGGVCGGANVMPRLLADIYQAAADGDSDRLAPLTELLASLGDIYQCGEGPAVNAIRGLKAALAELGIGNGRPADPLLPATQAQRQAIADKVRLLLKSPYM
jgi:4-hydroxy-tetrahydrodipicolinate synthase